ncbi:MAG TPA: helix-turn-helix domain-containing protein [Niastella sp.]
MTTDVKVQKIIQQAERRIRSITQNEAIVLVSFYKKKESRFSYEEIVNIVCSVTMVPYEEALKNCRKKHLVLTRHLITYYAKMHCRLNSVELADKLNKDHTTILSSLKKINGWMQTGDETICEPIRKINLIINRLNSKQ